ncbi:MAG: hypothetical protein CL607_05690 [Anaerolineaceae bacterium]|nr:hypothetical protein [Anaerolineaceae bacterium]
MATLYQDKLRERGLSLAHDLQQQGYKTALIEDSFRDYMVKLQIAAQDGSDAGKLNLYYSPKRKEFTLKTHEMKNKKLAQELESLWHELNNTTPAADINLPTKGYVAFVDGAHINGMVGYGAVILRDGKPVTELFGRVLDHQDTRQVAGELAATLNVLEWCEQEAVDTITIIYDYKGIEQWATGGWKTNKPLTRQYAAAAKASPVDVTWLKVKSHTGVKWNERADRLAKKGAQQRV